MIRHTGMVDHWLRAVPSVQPGSTGKADSPVGNAASSLTPVPRATSLSAASVHSTCNSQRTAAPAQRASFMAVSGERENVETNPPQTINDRDSAVLRDSAPFYSVAYEVRRTNKHDFNAKREELKRSWPEFGKHYEKYRQWRDCSESDPKLDKLRSEGVKAQLFIMQKANVLADPEKKRLFELLEKQPDLLKYVSPINGDFRAPRIGVLAGLRFTRDQSGVERPTLAFPGTGSGAMIRSQLRINRTQFLRKDRPPEAYELGVKLANTIRAELANSGSTDAASKLALTGHSLCGGIDCRTCGELRSELLFV